MDTLLEIRGRDFMVDNALADSRWRADARVWHHGDATKLRRDTVCLDSGFSIRIGGGDGVGLEHQIGEALIALRSDVDEIRRVLALPGIESACVRFGELWYPEKVAARFSRLPTPLLRLCGELGLDIMLCEYLTNNDPDDKLQVAEPDAGGNAAPPRTSA